MKILFISFALCIGWVSPICQGEESHEQKVKRLEEQMAALEREKAALASQVARSSAAKPTPSAAATGLYDAAGKINTTISNAVLVIEGDASVGTGFTVAHEGKKYLYTAAHVFSGNTRLTVKNALGTSFKKFGVLEAAEGADLIRMEILEEVKDYLELAASDSSTRIHTEIAALGNGGGTGVVAVEEGKILGASADSMEVDAGIIQGNSGGPVIDAASGKVLGVVTHLSSERKDLWSEGTRQAEVRRFACRVDKDWQWKTLKIGAFLADGKAVEEFDEMTRICFSIALLEPLTSGMRLDSKVGEGATAIQIFNRNKNNELVKSLLKMNTTLAVKKTGTSDAELKKQFRSLIAQAESQAKRSQEAFKPQGFAWFHRNRSEVSIKARNECLEALRQDLDYLR